MLALPPPRDESTPVVVQARQPSSYDTAEVLPCPTDVRIQILDELLQALILVACPPTKLVTDSLLRLLADVEVELSPAPEVSVSEECEVPSGCSDDPCLLVAHNQSPRLR